MGLNAPVLRLPPVAGSLMSGNAARWISTSTPAMALATAAASQMSLTTLSLQVPGAAGTASKPTTVWPQRVSQAQTGRPIEPLQPVTSTRFFSLLLRLRLLLALEGVRGPVPPAVAHARSPEPVTAAAVPSRMAGCQVPAIVGVRGGRGRGFELATAFGDLKIYMI